MYFAGVDVGSLTAKAVIINGETIVSYNISHTGYDARKVANNVMEKALQEAELNLKDIKYTVGTGYGRSIISFADKQVTEISCHARGAHWFFPLVGVVIDIGGQDSKIIKLNSNGRVIDFKMNDKCAAGTGRFLEVMAHALEVKLEDFGMLSLKSENKAEISSVCTVFSESEVISQIGTGTPKNDIIAGLHDSVARRVYSMLAGLKIEGDVVMTGGVAKNIGVVKALEEKIGCKILIPEEPQIIGALGAALISKETATT